MNTPFGVLLVAQLLCYKASNGAVLIADEPAYSYGAHSSGLVTFFCCRGYCCIRNGILSNYPFAILKLLAEEFDTCQQGSILSIGASFEFSIAGSQESTITVFVTNKHGGVRYLVKNMIGSA